MKNQTNRILVVFLIMGFVLLFNGCPADPSQNNQNNSNQNTADKNASNEEASTEDDMSPPPRCTSVTEDDIRNEIPRLPNPLKQQFDDGNITWRFDRPNHELVFMGYIHGNGVNLRGLLNRFNKFRGQQCLWKVVFQGPSGTGNFEWRPNPNSPTPTPPGTCEQDVNDAINNSILRSQLNENLTFNYDPATKFLTLTGYIGDEPGNMRFNAFIGQLQRYMRNGCITKIIFGPGTDPSGKVIVNRGFGWQICEYPECERNGMCVPCGTTLDTNTNGNTNSSSNTINSNTP